MQKPTELIKKREFSRGESGKFKPNKPELIPENVTCPKCNGKNLKLAGFQQKNKKRRYECGDCHRLFVLNPETVGRKSEKFIREDKSLESLPFVDCNGLLENFNKTPQTFDSLVGIPCTKCNFLRHGCIPETCSNLDNYLERELPF